MKHNELSEPDFDDNDEDTVDEVNEVQKFTDWAKEPSLTDLKEDLTEATSDHDAATTRISAWLDNMHIRGAAKRKKISGRSNVQPKLIRKQAEWRYASLSEPFLSTPDIYNADPETFEDKEAAIQNELVLNNQFNTKIQKVKFIDEYVRTAVDEGTVICRVGWTFEEEEYEEIVPVYDLAPSSDPNIAIQMYQFHELYTADPEAFAENVPEELQEAYHASIKTRIPMVPVPNGTKVVTQVRTVKNHPTVEVCDYDSVIFDPTCKGDITKANFVVYRYSTSLSDLERQKKYKNLDKIKLTDNASILSTPDGEEESESSFQFKDKPRQKFDVYEYWGQWDIDGSGITKPIKATWAGETLLALEENPFPDQQHPFVVAQYLPKRKSIYGEPDGELLESNQEIIGAVTRGMIDIMGRSANGQQGARKGALDVTNKRKFDKGLDYEFNGSMDPRTAFYTHTFPEIPNSAKEMLIMQQNDAEGLTGVKAFGNGGISGNALGDTATGVRSAMDATARRELGILRRLATGIEEIGRKFISMNAEFLSEVEVVRVTNDEFVPVRRDDLAGNFDLRLSISTAEADAAKVEKLAFMLQTIAPSKNMDPGLSKMILADITRIQKMPALSRRIEEFEPQPDPLEEQERMLRIKLLEAQIYNEQAKGNENNANANLDNAKAMTEQERARHLGSTADKADLDFIEQESGVTQERELQKATAQAEGNAKLKAMDHIFNMAEKGVEPRKSN